MDTMAFFFLVTVAVGGVAWVFIYPLLSGERQAEKRIKNIAKIEPTARMTRNMPKSRRDSLENTLKEVEERHKKSKKQSLSLRLSQAGLSWTKRQFILFSISLSFVFLIIGFLFGPNLPVAIAAGFAGGFGAPRWMLTYLKKRRQMKFLENLPDAVDVIVRGLKSGLPLLDCMKMITLEAPEPLKSEFRYIVETQAIGMPLGEACAKLYERTSVPEANFFAIVVSIQQKSGGNLAEALGNLSRVLRDRKKMKAKIRAMSQEAKASAGIIGSLPIVVMTAIYFITPNYISLLFSEPAGHIMLIGSAVWMSMGILVMKKMINFDF